MNIFDANNTLYLNAQVASPVTGYIFYGPKMTGKKRAADHFILQLLCLKDAQKKACMKCDGCSKQIAGIHPDMYAVTHVEGKLEITIDQILRLRESLKTKTIFSKYSIVLIEHADTLNKSAGNALLKILEELICKTVFILIDNKTQKILPTIVSRCQRIAFKPVPSSHLLGELKMAGASDSQSEEILFLSQGKAEFAENLFNNPELLENVKKRMNVLLEAVCTSTSPFTLFPDASAISWNEKQKVYKSLLADYKIIWHNILLYKLGLDTYIKKYHNQKIIDDFMKKITLIIIVEKLNNLTMSERALTQSIPGDLLIDVLI